MKSLLPVFILAFLLLAGWSHALRLTDGLYFTVAPNSTAEVYFILPDDLGAGQRKGDYYITTDSHWSTDLTEQIITTEENNTVITPIRFFSLDKKEGDCSNYTVRISAPSLSLSRTWRGGVCLSKYMDVDIAKPGKDPGTVLNSNADIFSLGFATYSKTAKPGDISIELLLQSQASLTIDVNVDSGIPFEQKVFVVQTSPTSQYKTLLLNASNILSGTYDVKATGKARSCSLDSCTRQAPMRLVVSDSVQEGFSVSPFPGNLARFYEIKATTSSGGMDRLASSYLSVNEMVSDVYRSADDIKSLANSSLDASVDRTVRNWYSSYSKSDGQNLTENKNIQDDRDSRRKRALSSQGQNQTEPGQGDDIPQEEEKPESPFNFGIILIPVALGMGVFLVLLLLRKRKGSGQEFLELK